MSLAPRHTKLSEVHLALMAWRCLEAHCRLNSGRRPCTSNECSQLAHSTRVTGGMDFGVEPHRAQLWILRESLLDERLVGVQLARPIGPRGVAYIRYVDVAVGLAGRDPSLDRAAPDLESPGQDGDRYFLFQIMFQQHTSLRVSHNWLRRCEGSLKREPAVWSSTQHGFGDLVLVLTPSCDYCGLFDPKCAIFNRRICAIFARC